MKIYLKIVSSIARVFHVCTTTFGDVVFIAYKNFQMQFLFKCADPSSGVYLYIYYEHIVS